MKMAASQVTSYEHGSEQQRYAAMKSINSQAVSYEHGSEEQIYAGMKVINKLTVRKGSTVLDLGCGTGYLTKVLSERVGPEGKVVAVDPDGERLKIAREKYSASNIEYIQADDKTFPPGQYDVIFSNIVIHWIHDKEALFKHVYESLQPGGHFVFTTYDGTPTFPPIVTKLFSMIDTQFLDRFLHEKQVYLSDTDYQALASDVGFTQISVDTENVVTEWKNLDTFIISAHGALQGELDLAQISNDTLKKLKEEYGDDVIRRPVGLIKAILTK